jgi:hypothetical protein
MSARAEKGGVCRRSFIRAPVMEFTSIRVEVSEIMISQSEPIQSSVDHQFGHFYRHPGYILANPGTSNPPRK